MMFWQPRLDSDEVQRLYTDYRGDRYFRARHAEEFWYTRSVNSSLGGETDAGSRKRLLHAVLSRHCDVGSFDSSLDYGGDRGQLLAEGPGRKRYVYDISGAAPVAGVSRVGSEAELRELRVDLLLLCNVLEHVSEPSAFLEDLKPRLTPNGILYVEVPSEQFPLTDIPAASWYERYLDRLSRANWVLRLADLYSTAIRVKFRRIPPLGFAKMHEHMNYYHRESLAILLTRVGFQLLECSETTAGGSIVALALNA